MQKLTENWQRNSLRVKPLKNQADPRIRTARVTDKYRAVMLEFDEAGQKVFFLLRIDNHDEAIAYAQTVKFNANPWAGNFGIVTEPSAESKAAVEARIDSRAKRKLTNQEAERKLAAAAEEKSAPTTSVDRNLHSGGLTLGDRLTNEGVSKQAVSQSFRLSDWTIEQLWKIDNEDDLDMLANQHESAQKDAILALGLSDSLGQALELLGLDAIGEVKDTSETYPEISDDEILAKLRERGLIVEVGEDELQEILTEGSFKQWRVFLHPTQRKAATTDYSGSARVTGGAGTGKTVVLLHRTKYLMEKNRRARIGLLTFTVGLTRQLKTMMSTLVPDYLEASMQGTPGLWISGIDALITRVLKNAQPSELRHAVTEVLGITFTDDQKIEVRGQGDKHWDNRQWFDAVNSYFNENPQTTIAPGKRQPEFLAAELTDVIITHGVKSEEEYLRVSRRGRGTPLARSERKVVWGICRKYMQSCVLNEQFTFPVVAMIAAEVLERRNRPMFDHLIVDEAQDFHAGHWRFIRAAVAPGPNDIFIAEDSHQRIYGSRISLSNFGIDTRGFATRRLTLNYRTTAQTLRYAENILVGGEWIDSEAERDSERGYRSLTRGPEPVVSRVADFATERELIADSVERWLNTSGPNTHIGILARTNQEVAGIAQALRTRKLPVSIDRSGAVTLENPVSVMTAHNAKGMEFTHVILSNISQGWELASAFARKLPPAEQEEALLRDRALLYVCATRARNELMITVVGKASPLLPS